MDARPDRIRTMTDQTNASVIEEYYEGEAIGLESETVGDGADEHKPWDPDRIRVTTKNFSLRHVLDLIEEKGLELAPDFQRNRVWKARQKSRLIESILLQIPLPAFYFGEDADGMMRVVDGQQRISTVREFVRGTGDDRFVLTDLQYLGERLEGKGSVDLEPVLKRRLHNTQIVVHVIDPSTPPDVTFNIFDRINTGGTPLNAQEVRHCMSKQRSRDFLRRCAETEEFAQATGGSLRSNLRMGDRELVLRFCAFRRCGIEDYRAAGGMDAFLLQVTRQLDDPGSVSDTELAELEHEFRLAMVNAWYVFHEHAFRKYHPREMARRNPINRSLFDCWSVALADYQESDIMARAEAIRRTADELMLEADYFDAITSSTGDPANVAYRHEKTREAARAS
jgi:hypothetical protein